MERLSTAMQITGIGDSSLGLIFALKILPFSPTHPTLGVALKKKKKKKISIGKFFLSSFGLSQGTSRPPPVTHGETPKKDNLRRCGEGTWGMYYLAQREQGRILKWTYVNPFFWLIFFFYYFGLVCVWDFGATGVGCVGRALSRVPFPNGFRQLQLGETRIELIKENLCVGNTCIT